MEALPMANMGDAHQQSVKDLGIKRDRDFLLKTRIVMVVVTTVSIIIASVVTWHVAVDTTAASYSEMRTDLREEMMSHTTLQVQQFLATSTLSWQGLHDTLVQRGVGLDKDVPTAASTAREVMWTTFRHCHDCSATIFTFARAPLFTSYRRGGPESLVLGLDPVVGLMDNVNDTESVLYKAHNVTGQPLLDGPRVRLCFIGSCPPGPLDPWVYAPPTENPHRTPLWLGAQGLAQGAFRLATNIGPLGDDPLLIYTGPVWDDRSRILLASISVVLSSSRLRNYLNDLAVRKQYGGIIIVTFGPSFKLLAATIEEPIALRVPGASATFLSALNSTNTVVQTSARHVDKVWGYAPPLVTHGNSTEMYKSAVIHVNGRHHYLSFLPLPYEGLQLGIFFVVPMHEFRGHIDSDRRRALGLALAIALGILIFGTFGIYLSTRKLGQRLSHQLKRLEDIGKVNTHLQAHIDTLEKERDEQKMREQKRQLPQVDMGTPLEKLSGLIDSLHSGGRPSEGQLREMRALVRARDLHKPKFLSEMEADPGAWKGEKQRADIRGIDKETSDWLVTVSGTTVVGTAAHRRVSGSSVNRSSTSSGASPHVGEQPSWVRQPDRLARVLERGQQLPSEALSALTAVCKNDAALAAVALDREGSTRGGAAIGAPAGAGGGAPHFMRQWVSFDPEKLVVALARLGEWDFDTLALAKASNDMPILLVGYSVFERSGVLDKFKLPRLQVAKFLYEMDKGMKPNPYHNRAHIADVAASIYHVLTRVGMEAYLRPIDVFGALCAALVHDFKHPGTNSDFVRNSKGDLALIYNDRSILENFHLAEAFRVMQDPNLDCNILGELSMPDYEEVRHIMIELVLASDLKQHFSIMESLRTRMAVGKRWDKESAADRLLLLKLAMKVADIGHAAKPLVYHLIWSNCMQEEFFVQGDAERALDLVVSPFMDRQNPHIPTSQVGFFSFIALPMFKLFAKAFPKAKHLLDQANENTEHWVQQKKDED
eukprot:jgi/Mesvir1/4261/Mv22224-RA.1